MFCQRKTEFFHTAEKKYSTERTNGISGKKLRNWEKGWDADIQTVMNLKKTDTHTDTQRKIQQSQKAFNYSGGKCCGGKSVS